MRIPDEFSSLGEPISRHSVRLKTGLHLTILFLFIAGFVSIIGDAGSARARVAGVTLSQEASQGVFFVSGVIAVIVALALAAMTRRSPRSLLVVIGENGLGTSRRSLLGAANQMYRWNEIREPSAGKDGAVIQRADGMSEELPSALPRYEALVAVISEGVKMGRPAPDAALRLAHASALQPLAFVLVVVLGILGVVFPIAFAGAVAVAIFVTVVRSQHRIDRNVVIALWALVGVFLLLDGVVWMR